VCERERWREIDREREREKKKKKKKKKREREREYACARRGRGGGGRGGGVPRPHDKQPACCSIMNRSAVLSVITDGSITPCGRRLALFVSLPPTAACGAYLARLASKACSFRAEGEGTHFPFGQCMHAL
jgi:hypothetical protein